MIHVLYFITRKPDMDEAKFHRYWREVHAPIVVKIPQLRRYVQSHRIDTTRTNSAYDDNVSTYDGVAEVHLDGLDAFAALLKTREYLEGALADEQNFLDLTRVEWMATTDHVMLDGPTGGKLVKGVWQLKRKPGMSADESTPNAEPPGTRAAISAVILPFPHPTSKMRSVPLRSRRESASSAIAF